MEETVAVEHTLLNHTLEVVLQCLSDAKDFGQRLRDSEARLVQAKEESREPELLLRLHELEKAKITADREQAAMSREIQRRRQELNQTRQWFDTETRRLLVEMEFHIASRLLEIKKENQQLLSRLERYRSQNRELKEAVNQEGPHKELISRLEREKQSEMATNRALRDTIKTLEVKLQQALLPSLDKHSSPRMLVQDLETKNVNLQGQGHRSQSRSRRTKLDLPEGKSEVPESSIGFHDDPASQSVIIEQGTRWSTGQTRPVFKGIPNK
ncbi:MAG: hypothetical protein OHK93_003338 [Ramalina farinacea]|uniref:Uncharacterized protein n=1 Tax=Ramalina farinacea TaxID=258253 RepID=A0AA43QT19_9LECA|nr:hypothetical protein [Ramalina farinacea]